MGFRWRADDGPFLVVIGSNLSSHHQQQQTHTHTR